MKNDKELMSKSVLETAESASAYAEARLEEVLAEHQKRKIKLIKITGMMIIVSVILVFATRSWFTMSREVEGTGANMTANDLVFEIKTVGSVSPNNSILGALGYKDGTPITSGATTAGVGEIKWLLQEDDDMAGSGLRPGTSGNLSFTIVPVNNDSSKKLSINYKIEMTAYRLSDYMKERIAEVNYKRMNGEPDYPMPTITIDDLVKLSGNSSDENYSKAIDYIKGHILFFKNSDNTGRVYIGETQTLTFSSTSEREIPLHWIWPDTLGDLVLTSNDVVNICTGDEKAALISNIQNNPGLYFYANDLSDDMIENNKLKSNVLGEDISDYYPILNLAYNDADQEIGVNVQYIMIELIVDGDLVSAE